MLAVCGRLRARRELMLKRRCGLVVTGTGLTLFFLMAGSGWAGKGKEETSVASRHVNQERFWTTLQQLAEFGKNPEGGVSRVGFTEPDLAGRSYVMGLMREAGLEVRIDPAGNIFGRRSGSQKLPVLLFGSHIDSVPHGGNYDGDVGTLGALEERSQCESRRAVPAT